ncbi:MAG TPA: 4Fe-4S dicluster domain-containing protein [Bacteroidetes bacterium]|nr:4Fe-4S dicluster domain-containing protein [Bacteroidota bacterium]
MNALKEKRLVYTVKDRCKMCYTCVRECPVKAIRIRNGQAEVISERCIGCGNCVKVCSQGAKTFLDSKQDVYALLQSGSPVVAMVAPSFPAEFTDISHYRVLVGMIRELGFHSVVEVAFGADMVSREYRKLLNSGKNKGYITSDCPALVNYVELYKHGLINSLAPIASPMVAMARVVRKKSRNGIKVVFIGPCVAKKTESEEVDAALTFRELREMFLENRIIPDEKLASDFDPPRAGKGAIFPVSRGLLQNVNRNDDIADGDFVVAEGKNNFRDAVAEFESGTLGTQHLELLCCEGCIMGPGMTNPGKRYARRTCISKYVKERLDTMDPKEWEQEVKKYGSLEYSQHFEPRERKKLTATDEKVNEVLRSMGKLKPSDHLNCGACGYDTCYEHAVAIAKGLAEIEMCLPYTIMKLHRFIEELNETNGRLAKTRKALKQSEKLASMGQLSAGIAHELNNPLGVITMYANILKEETPPDAPISRDLQLIVEQTERCRKIVGGLLNFARKNQVQLSQTNMVDFVQHSLGSIVCPDNVKVEMEANLDNPWVMIDNDQMMQVLTNLEKNAIEAMPGGGIMKIELSGDMEWVNLKIKDTGTGISPENMEKIFTPFFTTKALGKGTGLGLPLVYGIVKMHRGKIDVESNSDPAKGPTGTTFTITLPRRKDLMDQQNE